MYPVASGRQDIIVYVFMKAGRYRYDSPANTITLVVEGDHRAITGKQDFVATASVNLVLVQDMGKWSVSPERYARGRDWGYAHLGAIAQNAHLFCAGRDWSAVTRGAYDEAPMRALLDLPEDHYVCMTFSAGPGPQ